jgi:hypothetical protein
MEAGVLGTVEAEAFPSLMDLVIRLDGKVDSDDVGDEIGVLGTVDKVCARWRGETEDSRGELPFDFRAVMEEGITGRADEGGLEGGGGGKAGRCRSDGGFIIDLGDAFSE